jgi:hypothetical protein
MREEIKNLEKFVKIVQESTLLKDEIKQRIINDEEEKKEDEIKQRIVKEEEEKKEKEL